MKYRGEQIEQRVYGDPEYDHLFGSIGDIFKSKNTKKKESLDIQQKEAALRLTHQQQVVATAKAQSEVFKAKTAQMESIAAQKLAEKADVQLKGAEALKNLNYLAYVIGGLVVVGIVAGVIYMNKQGKRSALIRAKVAKAKLNKTPIPQP